MRLTPLSEFTSLRLGGAPERLIEAAGEEEIVAAVTEADDSGEPLLVLGGGSNVVIADEGFPGTVLLIRSRGIRWIEQSTGRNGDESSGPKVRVDVAAGENWDDFVAACVERELAGVECLSGIPGLAGATPIQNVGAYGQEVADTIVSVRVYDRLERRITQMTPSECRFGYRDSVFKRNPGRWIVLEVTFELDSSSSSKPIRYDELAARLGVERGKSAELSQVREAVLALRRGKGLLAESGDPDSATAGSFFTNPVLNADEAERLRGMVADGNTSNGLPPMFRQPDGSFKTSAAWLIQRAGFEPGYGNPEGIAISSRHCLVLTNRGGGSTAELLELAREIADGVERRFGVRLHPEPNLVGAEW